MKIFSLMLFLNSFVSNVFGQSAWFADRLYIFQFRNWIHQVGNPNPKVLILKANAKRSPNSKTELVSTKFDNQYWDYIAKRIPGFGSNETLNFFLIYTDKILLPENSFSTDSFSNRKPILTPFYFDLLSTHDGMQSVLYEQTYAGIEADSPFIQYAGFNYNIHAYPTLSFVSLAEQAEDIFNLDCFDNILYSTRFGAGCGEWLIVANYDTIKLLPSSTLSKNLLRSNWAKFYPNLPQHIGYNISSFSVGVACWHKCDYVSYLNWYAHDTPKGFEPQRHENKAYYLDTLFNTLVIGEQNPQTGEWQGDFEAYTFSKNTPATLFLKGQHDRNKRVGVWKYYNFYDTEKPILQTDSISSEGIFISSRETPFEGFSEAESAKFEQTVQAIISKNKK